MCASCLLEKVETARDPCVVFACTYMLRGGVFGCALLLQRQRHGLVDLVAVVVVYPSCLQPMQAGEGAGRSGLCRTRANHPTCSVKCYLRAIG